MMSLITRVLCLGLVTVLTACGGGGGGSSSSESTSSISGAVVKGPVVGGSVYLFKMDAYGDPTGKAVAGPITTAADGSWSVKLPKSTKRPLLVMSIGGSYTDEATGQTVDIGEGVLRSFLLKGQDTAAITPLTDFMVDEAVKGLRQDLSIEDSLLLSKAALQSMFKLNASVDPITTVPSQNGDEAEQYYNTLLSGISHLMHDKVPDADPFDAVKMLLIDISDGVLDGANGEDDIELNGHSLPAINETDLAGAIVNAGGDNTPPAGFELFKITIVAGENISSSVPTHYVYKGASVSVVFEALQSHNLTIESNCDIGVEFSTASTAVVEIEDVQINCTINASSSLKTYTVTHNLISATGVSAYTFTQSYNHGSAVSLAKLGLEGVDAIVPLIPTLVNQTLKSVENCLGDSIPYTGETLLLEDSIESACEITWNFEWIEHELSFRVHGPGNAVVPPSMMLQHGIASRAAPVTFPQIEGYNLQPITSCGAEFDANANGYVFTITQDCEADITYTLRAYEIHFLLSGYGFAGEDFTHWVTHGVQYEIGMPLIQGGQIERVIESDCAHAEVSLDRGFIKATAINNDCSVSVEFSLKQYTINFVKNPNSTGSGTLPPMTTWQAGTQGTLSGIVPSNGSVSSFTSNCGAITSYQGVLIRNLQNDCTVEVTFTLITYSFSEQFLLPQTHNAVINNLYPGLTRGNGQLVFSNTQPAYGEEVTISLVPDWQSFIGAAVVCGNQLIEPQESLTVTATQNCGVVPFFISKPQVVIEGSEGGDVATGIYTVEYKEAYVFAVVPDAGNRAMVTGCNGGVLENDVFTANPITAHCTFTVNFVDANANVWDVFNWDSGAWE